MGTFVAYVGIVATSNTRELTSGTYRRLVLDPRIRVHDRVHAFRAVVDALIFMQIDEFSGSGVARQALSWLRIVACLAREYAVEVDN